MINFEIIQILTGCIGSVCFGILFNIKGKRLVAVAFGGLLSWILFIMIRCIIPSEPIIYLIVALVLSLYAEIIASILQTLTTPIVTTSLIPLIPGGALYCTMSYALSSDFIMFFENAVYTLKLASALALGIILVPTIKRLYKEI